MRDLRFRDLHNESRREDDDVAPAGTDGTGDASVARPLYRLRRDASAADPPAAWIEPGRLYEGAPHTGRRGEPRIRLFHPSEPEQHCDVRRSLVTLVQGAPARSRPQEERRFLDAKRVMWVMTADPTPCVNGGDAAPEGMLVFSSPVETRRLVRTAGHRNWLSAPAADLRAWCRAAKRS
jgi:hypothetical protein